MPSAEDLRKEVRRLLREAEGFIDPSVKQELASRAFELAQRAERIDVLVADPGRLDAEIAKYRSRLRDASLSPVCRGILIEALADAESLMVARGIPSARAGRASRLLASRFPDFPILDLIERIPARSGR